VAECTHQAVLLLADVVEGTSTSVARRRIPLTCDLDSGHPGPHRNADHQAEWEGEPGRVTTLLREYEGE
jgi:hypothetical protein